MEEHEGEKAAIVRCLARLAGPGCMQTRRELVPGFRPLEQEKTSSCIYLSLWLTGTSRGLVPVVPHLVVVPRSRRHCGCGPHLSRPRLSRCVRTREGVGGAEGRQQGWVGAYLWTPCERPSIPHFERQTADLASPLSATADYPLDFLDAATSHSYDYHSSPPCRPLHFPTGTFNNQRDTSTPFPPCALFPPNSAHFPLNSAPHPPIPLSASVPHPPRDARDSSVQTLAV